jgi:hypothetical protein
MINPDSLCVVRIMFSANLKTIGRFTVKVHDFNWSIHQYFVSFNNGDTMSLCSELFQDDHIILERIL